MSKPLVRIIDCETNEVIDREMTDTEFEAYTQKLEIENQRQLELAQKLTDKAALLEKLGITEEEAKLLLS